MFNQKFYHGMLRKYISLFGALFDDILIDRQDASGTTTQTMKVPLSYGPKDRYVARMKQNPDLRREINLQLPRMTFEIKSIEYDNSRKLTTTGQISQTSSNGTILSTAYNPVPYNFNIDFSIITRNVDDGARIVEQILPYFTPALSFSAILVPELGYETQTSINLMSVDYVDDYEDSFIDRYAIVWTLKFVLKGYLFGPVYNQGLIKEVIANLYLPTTNTAAEGVNITTKSEYITVEPGLDANGDPTSNASISIPLQQIQANSDYGFITDIINYIG